MPRTVLLLLLEEAYGTFSNKEVRAARSHVVVVMSDVFPIPRAPRPSLPFRLR